MRIRRADVEGEAPGRRAELRRDGTEVIAVIYEDGEKLGAPYAVRFDEKEKLPQMASFVQCQIDGYAGTESDIQDYLDLIKRLAVLAVV